MSTIYSGHYPSLSHRGRAVRPDAYLAKRFREEYGSDAADHSNAYPHFIGVFDTVAAMLSIGSLAVVVALWLASVGIASVAMWALVGGFWPWAILFMAGSVFAAGVLYLTSHVKFAFGLPDIPWWKTIHMTSLRMEFYDTQLNMNVGWARHALAIDEHRRDFDRVPWGTPKEWRDVPEGQPGWFKQVWFAGNHSDIGGSYPEAESRLSDISLSWMLGEASAVPGGLITDQSLLRLYPSAAGMQHDETRGMVFKFAKKMLRSIKSEASLHPTVLERLQEASVMQYDVDMPYRPENLRDHQGSVAQILSGIHLVNPA